jgi:hypothetical protein
MNNKAENINSITKTNASTKETIAEITSVLRDEDTILNALPSGTYPPFNVAYKQAPPKPKVKRVGMFTMALALIAMGTLSALWVFLPNINMLLIARLSPVVLVLLGIEMLVYTMRHKYERLKFDFISIFIAIILIIISLAGATIPQILSREYNARSSENKIREQLEIESYALLQSEGYKISYIGWDVNVDRWAHEREISLENLSASDYVWVSISINNDTELNRQAFADNCKEIQNLLFQITDDISSINFTNITSGNYSEKTANELYTLVLDEQWGFNLSAKELEQRISVDYWLESEMRYISQWEYNDRLKNPEYY